MTVKLTGDVCRTALCDMAHLTDHGRCPCERGCGPSVTCWTGVVRIQAAASVGWNPHRQSVLATYFMRGTAAASFPVMYSAALRAVGTGKGIAYRGDNLILSSQYGDHTMYPRDICFYTLIPVTANTFTPLLRYPVTLHRHRCFGEPATDAASGTIDFSDVPPGRHQCCDVLPEFRHLVGMEMTTVIAQTALWTSWAIASNLASMPLPPGSTTLATLVMSSARSPNRMASRHAGRKVLDGASPRPHPAMGVTAGGSTGSQYVWQQGSDLIDQHQIN